MAKCIAKDLDYKRVSNAEAKRLVKNDGWHYISKGSFRHRQNREKRAGVKPPTYRIRTTFKEQTNKKQKGYLATLVSFISQIAGPVCPPRGPRKRRGAK